MITQTPIPCPDAGKKDAFGRVSNTACLVYHCKTERDTLYKEFVNRNDAFKFYNKAKNNTGNISFASEITCVEIDSVKTSNIPE